MLTPEVEYTHVTFYFFLEEEKVNRQESQESDFSPVVHMKK
jgi:hypothetical protein